MDKYLEFKEIPFNGKTKRFEIISVSSGDTLGRISWYSQWRQYTFSPSYPTVWNRDCLDAIINFINKLMNERATNSTDAIFKKEKICTCTALDKGICDTCIEFSKKYKNV